VAQYAPSRERQPTWAKVASLSRQMA
jgi:hypothetical protein